MAWIPDDEKFFEMTELVDTCWVPSENSQLQIKSALSTIDPEIEESSNGEG